MSPLSQHLFWDVDPSKIDYEEHASWLTRRVLEYGDWPDWQSLVKYYGKEHLATIVLSIRSMHPKAFAFCKIWFDLPEQSFRCFTNPQSL